MFEVTDSRLIELVDEELAGSVGVCRMGDPSFNKRVAIVAIVAFVMSL